MKAPKESDRMWTPPEWAEKRSVNDPVWISLKDREAGATGFLSLDILIDIAFQNNPNTRQAWLDSRAAYAVEKQNESTWYPQLTVSASTGHQRTYTNNKFNSINQRTDGVQAKLKYLLLDFGGRASAVKEAKEMLLASNYQFNQTFQDLILDVESAYYGFYAALVKIDAADANVQDAEKSLEIAQQRFLAGLVTQLDVLQSESNYTKALFNQEEARKDAFAAQGQLAKVIGVPAEAGIEIEPPLLEKPEVVVKKNVDTLIEEAMQQRPDIAAMKANLKAKEAALQSANSDLWPTLNISGTAFANEYRYFGSEKSDQFNAKDDYGYTAFISVDWNIFDGFYLYSVRNEAKEQLKAEREKLKEAELEASADVWTKYYVLQAAEKQYNFSVDFLKSSEAAYELAMESYSAGLKDILYVLKASADLFQGRSNMADAQEELFMAFAELVHSMGTLYVKEYGPLGEKSEQ
ncbi:TolC family protein [Candidatus Omnitrophota bacterium]